MSKKPYFKTGSERYYENTALCPDCEEKRFDPKKYQCCYECSMKKKGLVKCPVCEYKFFDPKLYVLCYDCMGDASNSYKPDAKKKWIEIVEGAIDSHDCHLDRDDSCRCSFWKKRLAEVKASTEEEIDPEEVDKFDVEEEEEDKSIPF